MLVSTSRKVAQMPFILRGPSKGILAAYFDVFVWKKDFFIHKLRYWANVNTSFSIFTQGFKKLAFLSIRHGIVKQNTQLSK